MELQQQALYQQLRAEAVATRDRIADLVRPLDPARLNEHPEPNGWSVAQVLEHLCLAGELYEKPLRQLLTTAKPDAGAPAREWKSSFIGGAIAKGLQNPKPIKRGPPAFRPGPTPRAGVVDAFLAEERTFVQVMEDALPYDWRGLRIKSPALPRWAPKMNVGDGFRIHVVHLTRHSRQIERLAKQL
jgi:hypothetical protein